MTPSAPPIGAFLWLLVILFSLMLYVVLDGYDLGVGVLLLFERDDTRGKEMIELIATSWDGNESWLVLVGMGLFAGFPPAYSTLLPALYVPVILMLLALIFRGVSFEFQAQARGYRRGWGRAFAVGSLVAVFCCSASVTAAFFSFVSLNSRTFSIAITACSANVFKRSISRALKAPASRRVTLMPPMAMPSRSIGTPRMLR